jgi:hypothetical protein
MQPAGEIHLFFTCIIRWRIPVSQLMIVAANRPKLGVVMRPWPRDALPAIRAKG